MGDLGVVLLTPTPTQPSDTVLIAVIPRYTVSKKKRKGGRPAPSLLDPNFVARFPSSTENNLHFIESRMFHPNGLEVLHAPSTHALKIESRPSEEELMLFQSSFGQLDVAYETEDVIQTAVHRAFRKESRRLWHAGDRVRILKGTFIGMSCSIHEIDEPNRTVIVKFNSLNPTHMEVSMEDLE